MNAFTKNILASLIAAGIIANVTVLFQVNARLARLETLVQIQSGKTIAQINEH